MNLSSFLKLNAQLPLYGRAKCSYQSVKMSKAELLGRFVYCGFNIIREDGDEVLVEKVRDVRHLAEQHYGLFIYLLRIGREGELIRVIKFRTMYPYAEYLQEFMYQHHQLQSGGKIDNDFRITKCGRWLRKYWLDELPMLGLLFTGKVKLVGVRPVSKAYYALLSPTLQQERIKHKPGLLPPLYADRATTLPEIEVSELEYLRQCDTRGTFRTDWRYFWKSIYNILFKGVRSA